ncbi:hypothetical protein C2845_PM05G31590 [Panicum miliaceum]|uniref:Uncharacterized protein n=1 Tax=Panicum miliaceum TaxID=4540 RepID=A0A3L6T3R0_PANMI|nr:hypothetical protein C2845_PM05G31590 [Panicum miliaceum]
MGTCFRESEMMPATRASLPFTAVPKVAAVGPSAYARRAMAEEAAAGAAVVEGAPGR